MVDHPTRAPESGDDKDNSNLVQLGLRPGRAEAEEAVRTLIRWIGEDPSREGLQATPQRVVRAWEELFGGYALDPQALLSKTFSEISGYDAPVILTDIEFQSHCEHHLLPIIGRVHVGYLPSSGVVGLSKIVRLCEAFSRRLQTQEAMTAQIAAALEQGLKPRGVAVCIEAKHYCMISRGIRSPNASTTTSTFLGCYREDSTMRREFLQQACRSALSDD